MPEQASGNVEEASRISCTRCTIACTRAKFVLLKHMSSSAPVTPNPDARCSRIYAPTESMACTTVAFIGFAFSSESWMIYAWILASALASALASVGLRSTR